MRKRKHLSRKIAIGIISALLLSAFVPMTAASDILTIEVSAGQYQIVDKGAEQIIKMEGFGYLMDPGKPMLPSKSFLIALPPGARVQSVAVKGIGPEELPGAYRILPTPLISPMIALQQDNEFITRLERAWEENNQATYSSDQAYPGERGELKVSGTLRKYSYASVSFYPFGYHPQSGRLIYRPAAQISIKYELPSPGTEQAKKVEEMKWDNLADEKASRLFVNYEEMKGLYQPTGPRSSASSQTHDYVIITTSALHSSIIASNFLSWKTSLGYSPEIVLTTDPQIAGQAGADLPEKIRNFLRYNYISWGMEYVLLVGDHATIPMRYCYPDPTNHANGAGDPSTWPWAGDVPTDYYYADLSGHDATSWDSDGDGFYGEYRSDSPDFLAEVYVGRIPTSDPARITYTLNKLVSFEQDTSDWKQRVLHAGAIAYFENEDYSGRELSDGAAILDSIEADLMSGWIISHYSEQGGLGTSDYDWPALTEAAFIGDWQGGQYGIVNWSAHGWSDRVARKIWAWDDGDGVPEGGEMSAPNMITIHSDLDDDHPSIVYAVSCLVGYPEPNAWGNMGVDLLTEPSYGASVGVLSGTRVVWVSKADGELMAYEFNRFMIDGPAGPERLGEALYDSEFFFNQNYTWNHFSEYWNVFGYNLYGDPSLVREGVAGFICGDCTGDGIIDVGDVVYLVNYLYKNGSAPDPVEAGDVNSDQTVDLGDVVHLVNYLFKGGPPPGEG
ncbi:MAG: C25 family cysteine peptidase [Candidatus Zixiibacteriota bacterium]